MRVWRRSLRMTKSTIISWHGYYIEPTHENRDHNIVPLVILPSCSRATHLSRNMTKPIKWHPPSLIKAFAVRMKKAWVLLSYPLSTQRRLIRLGDVQADLSLCWAHRSFCWFCHGSSHLVQRRGSLSEASSSSLYRASEQWRLRRHIVVIT